MRYAKFPLWTVAAALALLLASPLAAYTIYLKDGSTLQAKTRYKVENGRALITLPNGTQTFINLSEIDVRRTEEANRSDYGGAAVILDPGTRKANPQAPAAPQRKRLSDLITEREGVPSELPGPRREAPRAQEVQGQAAKTTRAGYVDLSQIIRKPYPQADVVSEMQQFFRGQGFDDVEIYAGTRPDRPLVELTTGSEGTVFRALGITANALLHVRDKFPAKVSALELLMTTPARERAGQFVLTPEMAADLVAKKVDLTAFFVQNVQF
ncbi:MAG TPA: hypothetical protein VF756_21825 [Thermoanaerobaculia bacterium]